MRDLFENALMKAVEKNYSFFVENLGNSDQMSEVIFSQILPRNWNQSQKSRAEGIFCHLRRAGRLQVYDYYYFLWLSRKLCSEPNLKGAYITTSRVQLTVVS